MESVMVRDGDLRRGQLFWVAAEWHRPLVCDRLVIERRPLTGDVRRVVAGDVLYFPYDCWTDRLSCLAEVRKSLMGGQVYHIDRTKEIEAELLAVEAEIADAAGRDWCAPGPSGNGQAVIVSEDDGEAG